MMNPEISIVVPVFNEEEVIRPVLAQLRRVLDDIKESYEVILVDDGSTDDTVGVVTEVLWHETRLVRLTKNCGHQVALEAGLEASLGKYVITLDADGQHPIALIPNLMEVAKREKVDVVYTSRRNRELDSRYKRWTASLYYAGVKFLTGVALVPHAADFRLVTRRVLQDLRGIREEKIFRLLLPQLGYSSAVVEYEALERQAGESKYTTRKMLKLATSSVLQFSAIPLRLVAYLGSLMSGLALLYLVYILSSAVLGETVSGWASLTSIVLLLGGVQLLSVGLIGVYVGKIYDSSRGKPRFLVQETIVGQSRK